MRQLTIFNDTIKSSYVSKLPMRQLTNILRPAIFFGFSKLPMRQLTAIYIQTHGISFSKLPMRQLTSDNDIAL